MHVVYIFSSFNKYAAFYLENVPLIYSKNATY